MPPTAATTSAAAGTTLIIKAFPSVTASVASGAGQVKVVGTGVLGAIAGALVVLW